MDEATIKAYIEKQRWDEDDESFSRNWDFQSPNDSTGFQPVVLNRGKERGRPAQAHRVRLYRRRTRLRTAAFLHRAVQSLSELSPAVRFCDPRQKSARTDQAELSGRRLPHPVREALFTGQMATIPQARNYRSTAPGTGDAAKRYRGSQRNAEGQTRHSQTRPDSILTGEHPRQNTRGEFDSADRGRGLNRRPLPSRPIPGCKDTFHQEDPSISFPCSVSGSSRIGITLSVQAHPALESDPAFSLISGTMPPLKQTAPHEYIELVETLGV